MMMIMMNTDVLKRNPDSWTVSHPTVNVASNFARSHLLLSH